MDIFPLYKWDVYECFKGKCLIIIIIIIIKTYDVGLMMTVQRIYIYYIYISEHHNVV